MHKIKQLLHKIFSDQNLASLHNIKLPRLISVLDIGARDGIGWPWNSAKPEAINSILVEPDPDEIKELQKRHQGEILPYALWSEESELTLNINHSPGTSSVFDANQAFLQQFADNTRFNAKNKIKINTKTIDGLVSQGGLTTIDFIKIDVQGAELDILKGGVNYLKNNLVGLESEVEFSSMYENQPLFSELEIFVRKELGLELWDIRKTYWKYKQKQYKNPTKGRLIFGDALFLRPISTLDTWLSNMDKNIAKEKLVMLIITTIAYGYLDYTNTVLQASLTHHYLTDDDRAIFTQYIDKLHKSFYPFKNGNSLLYQPLNVLANCFKPTYNGWVSSDASEHLGSRKKGFFWF